MVSPVAHILIAAPPAFGHVIPAVSLAKRIVSTPSYSERDDKCEFERHVTLLISKSFLLHPKGKRVIPTTGNRSDIHRGRYGSVRMEPIEDDVDPLDSASSQESEKFFSSMPKHIKAIGEYLQSKKKSTFPPSCIILDMFSGMFEPFPFDSTPYYFFGTTPVDATPSTTELKIRKGVNNALDASIEELMKDGLEWLSQRAAKSQGPLHSIGIDDGNEASHNQCEGRVVYQYDQADSNIQQRILGSWVVRYLDEKPPNSVIYVSFGTVVRHSDAQIIELLKGLDATGRSVLWSLNNTQQKALPTKEMVSPVNGVLVYNNVTVVEWAPQKAILSHTSCSAFLTHCGWNSAFESLICGIGSIHWPVFGDQPGNSNLLVRLGAGIAFDLNPDKTSQENASNPNLISAECITSTIEKFYSVSVTNENPYTNVAKKISAKLKLAWTPEGEAYHELVSTEAGSIMMWGCMTSHGIGFSCRIIEDLEAELYSQTFDDELMATLQWYNLDKKEIIFQHDNDPMHKEN
ncbi:uncharacterized protein VTP21DRAFT_11342 [Calcarisporiella thermophila]|uniref:uncharacterized protein n=1 Tax=Calcarisporiella thermophila TaxID=911321 RepID=UPI0037434B4E